MSTETVGKISMLDQKLEKLRVANRKQLVHSIVVVSRLSPDILDKRDIQRHYEKIFKNCHLKYQGDGPTGILLIYPQHAIHYLEAPLELLNTVITDLGELGKQKALLCDSRLLNFSSGLEQRFYPQWSARQLNLPSLAKGEVYQTNDAIELTVSTCLEKMYQLGCQLSKLHQIELKRTLDILPEKLPNLLIQQDILEYLVCNKELDTPAQYLQQYCTPLFVALESDFVWPLSVRLFPYD
ncbi:PREDICTED: uncharacterized protein C7orf62 homolog [Amphimedon queenslandica]|uniref:BLUF domain-containing protein n=1 Tax=Amphimedon queenslandica TaxID=400682 RepID=A0A1X7VEP0_AMPQE|nr:PREDICTED: uncharacterized protein C7orf62 homolog [Amphimedon queenslandica]|eukprot:XP_003384538.1 PREDICTED: uncharacterized protein C7orf62 homolog [Amphimedon queenslandica]